MAGKRDRLQTLLRVRRIEEDQAKAALAAANHTLRAAEGRVDSALQEYSSRQTDEPVASADSLDGFMNRYLAGQTAARAVVLAQSRREDACAATEQARDVVQKASMRSEGLQRLVDRAAQERRNEILAADQRTAEEGRASRKLRGRP